MSTTSAQIIKAAISGIFVPGDVSPLQVPLNINLPLSFSEVSNIQKFDGSYTPANDTQTIHTFSSTDQANFFLLLVDQPAVVSLSSNSASPISNACIQRFLYAGLQTLPSGLLSLVLNGASSGPEVPMVQGVACNWTLLYGVATIA